MEPDENELRELRRTKFRAAVLEMLGIDDSVERPFENDPDGRRKRLALTEGVGRHANSYQQKRRNALIVELAEDGWTQQEIAGVCDLDRSVVSKIIRKFKQAA